MNSKRQFGSCVNDIYGHTVDLKKVGPTFSKLTQMQSILILSSFVHPCMSLLAFCSRMKGLALTLYCLILVLSL